MPITGLATLAQWGHFGIFLFFEYLKKFRRPNRSGVHVGEDQYFKRNLKCNDCNCFPVVLCCSDIYHNVVLYWCRIKILICVKFITSQSVSLWPRPYLLWYTLLYTERVHLCSETLINCTYFLLAGFLLMWKRGTWIHGSGLLRYALELPPLPLCGSMSADASTKGFAGPVHFILLCRLNIFYIYSLLNSEHTFVWQCAIFVPPTLLNLPLCLECDTVTYLSPLP